MSQDPLQLTVQQLSCQREQRELFNNLHFELESGELLVISGPNGSGKTSLLRILCGLSLPDTGTVSFNGQAITKHRAEYHSQLAYVAHQSGIKAELTPIENLRITQQLSGSSHNCINTSLEKLGLTDIAQLPCYQLSAGQQRRVALARLFVLPARLWILDEPFSALDKGAVSHLEQCLQAHISRGGMAVLTSHLALNADIKRKELSL